MKHIPLYFRFEQIVVGRSFVADVRFLGRATCTRESDAIWMYGVNPGAIAGEGDSLLSAYADFRDRLVNVFSAFAKDANNFQTFQEEAQSFFEATDDTSVNEWEVVREAIRSGARLDMDCAELHRETGEPALYCTVVEKQTAKTIPERNRFASHQGHSLAA